MCFCQAECKWWAGPSSSWLSGSSSCWYRTPFSLQARGIEQILTLQALCHSSKQSTKSDGPRISKRSATQRTQVPVPRSGARVLCVERDVWREMNYVHSALLCQPANLPTWQAFERPDVFCSLTVKGSGICLQVEHLISAVASRGQGRLGLLLYCEGMSCNNLPHRE